jgi:hypothetical protein
VIGAILLMYGNPATWIIGSVAVVFLLGVIILRLLGWIIHRARQLVKRETAERAKADLSDLKDTARSGTGGYAQLERLRDNDTYRPS